MKRIAVFASGGGNNLKAIIDAQNAGIISSGRVCLVVSNKSDAYALVRGQNAGITTCVLTSTDDMSTQAMQICLENKIDLIALAGFLPILKGDILEVYNGRILNTHPSLIPSFCGKGFYGLKVHEAVLKAGVKVTGSTVHFVTDVVDGGGIIMQKAVCVEDDDTPESLQKRVIEQAETVIFPLAIEKILRKL